MLRRTLALLPFLALLVWAPEAHASSQPGAPLWVATPHAPIVTPAPAPYCQFDVYKGVLTIERRGEGPARYVSVIVVNNRGDRAVALHGYTHNDDGDTIWTHGVWHTYTQKNIYRAWMSGHRCEGT